MLVGKIFCGVGGRLLFVWVLRIFVMLDFILDIVDDLVLLWMVVIVLVDDGVLLDVYFNVVIEVIDCVGLVVVCVEIGFKMLGGCECGGLGLGIVILLDGFVFINSYVVGMLKVIRLCDVEGYVGEV